MTSPRLLERHVMPLLRECVQTSRVVFLNGARQSGKTTLIRWLAEDIGAEYQNLDDRVARERALDDPEEFVARDRPLVIDEVQRGGNDLLLAIKARVDRVGTPGQFLLTGSTRFLTVPNLSESLAGRVDLIDLWPLSQDEIDGTRRAFVDQLFTSTESVRELRPYAASREDSFMRACRGGFPEAIERAARMRTRWFESYVRTLAERDVGEITNVRRVSDLPSLVRLLAARTATEINVSSLANDAGIPRTTLHDYLPLLESVFLVFRLPAWSRNLTSRTVKQSKLHFTDSGLAAHLVGSSPDDLARPGAPMAGPLLESFVASEIARQATWGDTDVTLHHFRDSRHGEIDLVLESRDGRVAAIEVKTGRSVGKRDLKSLKHFRDRVGDDFVQGVVLANAESVQPLGDRLTLVPISVLWA